VLAARLAEGYAEIIREGALFVAEEGDDTHPGSSAWPKATIAAAVDVASEIVARGDVAELTVRIALGNYTLAGPLELPRGVSLHGGFDTEWSAPGPDRLSNVHLAAGATVISIPGTVTGARLANLSLTTEGAALVTGIDCEGSAATIVHCTVDVSSGEETSAGILAGGEGLLVDACTIRCGGAREYSWGIACSGADVTVRNTVIRCLPAAGTTVPLHLSSSDATLRNLTVHGGRATGDTLLFVNSSRCTVENTILFASEPSHGIRLSDSAAEVESLRNNLFLGCDEAIIQPATGGPLTTIAAAESYLGAAASDNAADLDPGFVDVAAGDYHITTDALSGLDLSAEFGVDRDGAARTVPWSAGAYELE
jgi:hypothetical protein